MSKSCVEKKNLFMNTRNAAIKGIKACKNFTVNPETAKLLQTYEVKWFNTIAGTSRHWSHFQMTLILEIKTKQGFLQGPDLKTYHHRLRQRRRVLVSNEGVFRPFQQPDWHESVSQLSVCINHQELASLPITTSPLAISLKLPSLFPLNPHFCQVVGQEN